MADETISEKCETLYNKLNTFVASVISRDVTPKISNLNTEVWGSDTQTGSSRIDTLNTNFDNLNNSITTINIECSDYNPSIDSNITVTITVTDVYGDAISGESVTVTASEGNFTQLNGSSITASSSVTGITGANGTFTLTYTCSEWGLATFSANNSNIQIKVTGVKTIIITSNITLYVNGDSRTCTMRIDGLSGSVSKADTPNVVYTIPSAYAQYLPKTTLLQQDYNKNRIDLLGSDGKISMMQSAAGSGSLNVTFIYNY